MVGQVPKSSSGGRPHCQLADASIFLGITTMPLHRQKDFLDGIRRFVGNYQEAALDYLENGPGANGVQSFKSHFYKPMIYVLLGRFDLAVLALMEDFEFGTLTFSSFDPMWLDKSKRPAQLDDNALANLRNEKLYPFAHRVILGPCPRWNKKDGIISLANRTFLPQAEGSQPQFPLIGICQVEVNTSLLVGGGSDFLRSLVKAIRSDFDKYRKQANNQETELIILESYSWHELTLLYFSNSFQKIIEAVARIRAMRLIDLAVALSADPDEWQNLLRLGNLYGLLGEDADRKTPARLEDWLDRTQLPCADQSSYIKDPVNKPGNPDDAAKLVPFGTHVVFNTTTTLGFWSGFLEEALKENSSHVNYRSISNEEQKLVFIRYWNVKAGHDGCVMAKLGGVDKFLISPGRADMIGPCQVQPDAVSFEYCTSQGIVQKMIEGYINLNEGAAYRVGACGAAGEPCAGALSVSSGVAVDPAAHVSKDIPEGHPSADEIRERMACHYDVIEQTFRALRKLRLPKVLSEQVLNAIGLYNDGILDNFLFSSLVELRPYLQRIVRYILEATRNPGTDSVFRRIAPVLGRLVHNFVVGWRNRFHGGWRLGELTDFNLEFKGGIQQLLSAFQGAYRLMNWGFTLDEDVLAIVTGEPDISVELGALKLSFQDIFRPSFFASRVGHETSEQILELSHLHTTQIQKPLNWLLELSFVYSQQHIQGGIDSQLWDSLLAVVQTPHYARNLFREVSRERDRVLAWCHSIQGINTTLNVKDDFKQWWEGLTDNKRLDVLNKTKQFCEGLMWIQQAPQQVLDPVTRTAAADVLQFNNAQDAQAPLGELLHRVREAIRDRGWVPHINTLWVCNPNAQKLFKVLAAAIKNPSRWDVARQRAQSFCTTYLPTLKQKSRPKPLRRMMIIAKYKEPQLSPLVDEAEPRFFDQVFADICNFVIVFGGDEELYTYRSLGSFVVTPECWDSGKYIRVRGLWEALVRLFLALGANAGDGQKPEQTDWNSVWDGLETVVCKYWAEACTLVDKEQMRRFLQEDLDAKGQDIIKLARELAGRMHKETFYQWCQSAVTLARVPLGFGRCKGLRFRLQEFVDMNRSAYNGLAARPGADNPQDEDWVNSDLGRGSSRYDEACQLLKDGKAFVAGRHRPMLEEFARQHNNNEYPIDLDHWFDFCDTVVLLRAYLKLLMDGSGLGLSKQCILNRDEEGAPVKTDLNKQAFSRFDQRGGVFTTEPGYRRYSFMLRSTLVMSLFDLSEKAKLMYCWKAPKLVP